MNHFTPVIIKSLTQKKVIKLSAYNELVFKLNTRLDVVEMIKKSQNYDLDFNALLSILIQKKVDRLRKNYYLYKNEKKISELSKIWKEEKKSLVTISNQIADLTPVMFARLMLPILYSIPLKEEQKDDNHILTLKNINENKIEENNNNTDKNIEKQILTTTMISKMIKQPELIQNERLKNEIIECNEQDDCYSSRADKIKRAIGYEYEYLLNESLFQLGIKYLTEDEMRTLGYARTPDFLIQIPFSISGKVVNWIDSKASFGDIKTWHHSHEQFQAYKNRHGPGLVIFHFGFIEELQYQDPDILVLSELPSEITHLSLNFKNKKNI